MKYAWIDEHKAQWSVAELCRSVGVSSSGYYAHKQRIGESKQQGIDAHLRQTIEQQCKSHKGRYGRPRMTAQLRKLGWVVNHKRVGKIMKQMGLQCQLRRKHKICTTQSKHSYSVAPNVLDRCFTQNAPNQAWSADITYIHTAETDVIQNPFRFTSFNFAAQHEGR